MYIRLPVSCSSASETEATSTRRKSAIKASSDCGALAPPTACARKTLAPHRLAQIRPMNSRDTAIVWDFTKPRNLFISSSWMYICGRTLTLFFVRWKSQSIYCKGESKDESDSAGQSTSVLSVDFRDRANHSRCHPAGLRPGTEGHQFGERPWTSFQRRHLSRQYSVHRRPAGRR